MKERTIKAIEQDMAEIQHLLKTYNYDNDPIAKRLLTNKYEDLIAEKELTKKYEGEKNANRKNKKSKGQTSRGAETMGVAN